MRRRLCSLYPGVIFGIAGLFIALMFTGCVGVSSVGPNLSAASAASPGTSTNGAPASGSITFTGQVQRVSSSSITVQMPNGQPLTASIVNGQTDLSDFQGALPGQSQTVALKAIANTDGSFTAKEIKAADGTDSTDQNIITYAGVVTSSVGADNVLHFRVGTQDFSFTLSSTTDLTDFQNNAQSIGNNQSVEVKVAFQGNTPTVVKVSLQNDQNNPGDSQNN